MGGGRNSRIPILIAGLTIASLTGLTGCSDDPPDVSVLGNDTPSTMATATATATPSPSTPSPTPPTITPTTGESPTRTLVRQYIALHNYAFETGEVEAMLKLAAEGCQSCIGSAELIREVYGANGRFIGDPSQRIVEMEGNEERIFVITEYGEWGKVASANADPEMYKAGQNSVDFILKQEGKQWVVAEIRAYRS